MNNKYETTYAIEITVLVPYTVVVGKYRPVALMWPNNILLHDEVFFFMVI